MTEYRYIALALTALISGCGDETTTATPNSEASAPAKDTPPIALKQTGNATGVDFTVTDVATPNQIGPGGIGPKAEAGETFVVVSYTLKNTGGAQLPMMERPGLSLIDSKGQSFPADEMATAMAGGMMDDPSGMVSDLSPNVLAKSKAAWKLDKAAFDRGTWRLIVASDPQLTFALR